MSVEIRQGVAGDAETVARHRCLMFLEMGSLSEDAEAELYSASIQYFRETIADGRYVPFFAIDSGQIIGGGGMQLNVVPPRPGPDKRMLPVSRQGLIVNVYVEPAFRKLGIAKSLMERVMEFAEENGIPSLCLHASPAGRPLYEKLGFTPTAEMRLFIPTKRSAAPVV